MEQCMQVLSSLNYIHRTRYRSTYHGRRMRLLLESTGLLDNWACCMRLQNTLTYNYRCLVR